MKAKKYAEFVGKTLEFRPASFIIAGDKIELFRVF